MSPEEKNEVVDLVTSMLTATGHATHVRRSRRGRLIVELLPTEAAPGRTISVAALDDLGHPFGVAVLQNGEVLHETADEVPTSGLLGALSTAIGTARDTRQVGPYRNRRKTSRRR